VIKLIIILFSFINLANADTDSCKFFKYCGGSSSRSSSQSVPSTSSAASLNPGNISEVKGFGVEAIYQSSNPLSYDVVTGDGKIGALVSPSLENSFFGNRSIEMDDVYYARRLGKIQYKNTKLNLAVGANILNHKNLKIAFGISAKRNPDIRNINFGAGVSVRLPFVNFGVYLYQDDQKINLKNYINPYNSILYSTIFNGSTYQEKFSVKTYTVGTKIKNLSLDYGMIETKYKFYSDKTIIRLYSGAYSYKSLLFSFALRNEDSSNQLFKDNSLVISRNKVENFYGVDYLLKQSIVLGVQYNYFLLNEWSAKFVLFF